MSNVEDRLNRIHKIDVTEQEVLIAKSTILNKAKKPSLQLGPIFVSACMFAILCFLVFVPMSNQAEQASSILTDEIKEIHYITSDRPNLRYRADSFNYIIAKKIIQDEQSIQQFQLVLQQQLVNPVPYTEKLEGYDVYELAFKMQSGEVYYLKYNRYSDEGPVFYDSKEKLKYVIPNYNDVMPLNDLLQDAKAPFNWNLTYVWIILIILFLLTGILDYLYRKKYSILDERGKRKRLTGWKHFIPYTIFIVPLFLMTTLVGTIHLGLMIVLIQSYMIVHSQLEIKYGIVRKNTVYLKLILPLSCVFAIVGLLLILVV